MSAFVLMTLAIAAGLFIQRRYQYRFDAGAKAMLYLVAGVAALLVSARWIVTPALMPARAQLAPFLHSDVNGPLLLFLCATTTVGVAATSLLAAQSVHAVAVAMVRLLMLLGRQVRAVWWSRSKRDPAVWWPDATAPQGSAPQDSAPQDSAPQDSAPQDSAPQDSAPASRSGGRSS